MSNQARTMRVSGSVVDQPGGGGRPGHAVVGFDGSDAAHDAVAFAAGWARRTGAALDIVYVADSPWQWVADAGYAGACAEFWDEPSMLSAEVADAMLGSALVWSYLVATATWPRSSSGARPASTPTRSSSAGHADGCSRYPGA